MAQSAATSRKFPLAAVVISAIIVALVLGLLLYLSRPAPRASVTGPASPEARAYVRYLALSNVDMRASENFMKQQVVEVHGVIANHGPKALNSVDVNCLFYGINGQEIHRERVPIVRSKGAPLKPGESRPFRLPFDDLPDGWNQAMPRLVIAQITFANQ